jgi:hypothetical protein
MVDPADDVVIPLRTYTYMYEAMVDKAKLDSAQIDCFIKNDNMEVVQPFFSQIDDGIKLMVRQSDAETAMAILNDLPDKEEL